MNLVRALRLSPTTRLGLVGAGGKTTTLFQIARQLPAPVLVTATTHLAVDQLPLADRHFIIHQPRDVDQIREQLVGSVLLVTGPAGEGERVAGLDFDSLERLHHLADQQSLPLLIEADGSRQKPLKAPAEHEPALPPFVDTVVVIAGLSGLSKPLTEEWVHRPERFGALAQLRLGEQVKPENLTRVLIDPGGGLKNIPPGARKIVLLNQADSLELQAQAFGMVRSLLPFFAAVIVVSSSDNGVSSTKDGGVRTLHILAVHERVAGIVLAAGSSSRMGRPKQLLSWRGQPILRLVAMTALAANLSPVIVVTGANADVVQATIQDLPVVVEYNPEWEAGQSSSIKTGVKALPLEVGAVVFLLADQPQVPDRLLRSLVERHTETLAPIIAPQVAGHRANPVLFDCSTFRDLIALSGDMGGRSLFSRYPIEWLEWQDNGLLLDVDTPADYQRLLEIS